MPEIAKQKERSLIRKAIEVFMTYGIKSVTMDDMARRIHVSKKTIYRFVHDKKDLVRKCVSSDCQLIQSKIEAVIAENRNAIDENFGISSVMITELRNIHPSIFYDLEKYYPEAMNVMHNLRQDFIANVILRNMEKGIREGLYRKDLNAEIMTQLWVMRMNVIFNPSLFPMQDFHPRDVYLEMFTHHLRGIASTKGLEALESQLIKLKELN